MTIKQLGGVFGRNPTFNDVTIEGTLTFEGAIDITSDLTVDGTVTANGLTVNGGANLLTRTSSGAEVDVLEVRNNATAASTASTIKFVNSTAAGSNSGSTELVAVRTGTNTGDFKIRTSNSTGSMIDRLLVGSSGDLSLYEDTGTTAKLLWDASQENLAIGASSVVSDAKLQLAGAQGSTQSIMFTGFGTDKDAAISHNNGDIILSNGGNNTTVSNLTERMRIGSSGNVLIGKSASDVGATEGFEWYDTANVLTLTRDAGHALSVNRLNGSGDIIQFREDGGVVGSIGVATSVPYFINKQASGSGLRMGTGVIQPSDNAGAKSDDTHDLGSSSGRFKDLYLSGGVVFGATGGTVTSKTLDDYEEGTWTPTVAGDATGAFSTAEGTYTKVGRLVFIQMYVVVSTNFTSNYIGGLPFTVGDFLTATSIGQSAVVLTNAADTVTGAAVEAQGTMRFYNDHNTASLHNPNTTNGGYRLALCYQV